MSGKRRITLYLNARLYRTLKIKAKLSSRTLTELVNEAVAVSLTEDAIDSETIRKRAKEHSRQLSSVLRDLERHKSAH